MTENCINNHLEANPKRKCNQQQESLGKYELSEEFPSRPIGKQILTQFSSFILSFYYDK